VKSTPAIEGGHPVRGVYLPFSPPAIGKEEIDGVVRVLKSGWITRGRVCEQFEEALASYTGAPHAVALSSATAGLFLSLKIGGIGPGDEVITTPYTFAATANVILHAGASPVFADIEPGSFNVSPAEIEKKITKKTRALIPVDFGGHPAEMEKIEKLAKSRSLLVIEDAAHAVGARYAGGRRVGGGNSVSVFSFHAVKNLTTAEGGAVMTRDGEIARLLRLYSLHGQTKDAFAKLQAGGWRYDIEVPGFKFNMTDIQAALGVAQLRRLDANRERREKIAGVYGDFFGSFDFVRVPRAEEGVTHAWHLYPLVIDFSRLRIERDRFIAALAAENVSANVHYIPVHVMSYYKKTFGYEPGDYPVSYSTFLGEVSLPIYPGMSERDVGDVCEACGKLFEYYRK
jgi:dTDP-4-amino-4,6-dideoxygalactose transaminase